MLDIIFEDNHLLVVDKPHMVATQPELEEAARAYIKGRDKKEGNAYVHVVHRIDKPVRGIVVMAKSSKALSRLNESMRDGGLIKEYDAILEGDVQPDEGEWADLLEKKEYHAVVSEKGKPSVLFYKVTKRGNGWSMLDISLQTGRYHQIRVQSSSRGHPVVGDAKYGAKTSYEGIALLHKRCTLYHPVTKEKMIFSSKKKLEVVY